MMAEEAARITIKPTARLTFPFAIELKGGPYGAPGQTAAVRKPAEIIGAA
jgi:hypothetical protein